MLELTIYIYLYISMQDDVVTEVNRFRDRGIQTYMVFKIIEESWVVVESISGDDGTFEDFTTFMTPHDCR